MKTRKTNPFIKALNNAIKAEKVMARNALSNAKLLNAQKLALRVKFAHITKGLDIDDFYVSVMHSGRMSCMIYLRNLASFKDARLVTLLNRLSEATDDIETTDYPENYNRDYVARVENALFRICAYVVSDSEQCQRIEVGREKVEVPVYKLICN